MPVRKSFEYLTLFCMIVVASEAPAHAYLGPGLGMGAVGVALGVVGSILLGFIAIIWYPFKRLWRALRGKRKSTDDTTH